MNNIFEEFLQELSVPHTTFHTAQRYATHPQRDNMLGLWLLARDYGIQAKGICIEDKNLDYLSIPSILHLSNHFALLTDIDDHMVTCRNNGVISQVERKDIIKSWSGKALVVESTTGACEPNYEQHRRKAIANNFHKLILATTAIVVLILLLGQITISQDWQLVTCGILDLLGAFFSFLLMSKQFHNDNKWGDKACTLFHQKDCKEVLQSNHNKLMGFSWSEIGFSYFLLHYICVCLSVHFPILYPIVIEVGWCAMLYSLWSIYVQARIIRSWCVLCLAVQAVVWMQGISAMISLSESSLSNGISLFSLFCLSLFLLLLLVIINLVHLINFSRITAADLRAMTYNYQSLKFNGEVIHSLLISTRKIIACEDTRTGIIFGHPDAEIKLTILTNPHCAPCAQLHSQIEELLQRHGDTICVEYVFCSFHESLQPSTRFLIATYQQEGSVTARRIYSEWYTKGRLQADAFIRRHAAIHWETVESEIEMHKHEAWREKYGFYSTPTILLNGSVLPHLYTSRDLLSIIDNYSTKNKETNNQ